jgi:hypothetical protein
MQLEIFVLADAVATPPGGKFYVHGGGLSRVEATSLPSPIQFAVLVQLGVDEQELKAIHKIVLTLFGPTKQPNVAPIEIETRFDASAEQALLPGEERTAVVAIPVHGLAIRAGAYRVELRVDDELRADRTFALTVPEGVDPVVAGLTMEPMAAHQPAAVRAAKQKRPPLPPKRSAKRSQ